MSSSNLSNAATQVHSNVTTTSSTNGGHYNLGVLHSSNSIGREELLKKIGGKAVLHKAVDEFYQRLVNDPQISVYFEGANLQVLKWHQYNLVSIAFHPVPEGFDVSGLILDKHPKLFANGLNEYTYDLVLQHFSATLRDLNVPEDAVQEALQVVTPLRESFARGAAIAKQNQLRAQQKAQLRSREVTFILTVAVVGIAAVVATTWLGRRQRQQQRAQR